MQRINIGNTKARATKTEVLPVFNIFQYLRICMFIFLVQIYLLQALQCTMDYIERLIS
jgi:hypothetical protein